MHEENQEKFALLLLRQIHFLEEHLSTWIPLFTEKIMKSAKTDLYKGAGFLLNDFLEFDIDSLKEFEEAMTNV
jgi:TorA maturation chaperone TorD